MIATHHIFILSALLLSVGVFMLLTKRNAILILMGLELILNAANLNLIAFNQRYADALAGEAMAVFVIVLAVCEAAVGVAIILQAYRHYATAVPDQISELKDPA
ncbi:MAG: NADH-quinone oxidoreductase subunit NuoK [Cyclobacteriaceae bacterium]|jgi:NADH-quinone oxidoreductase subunit K|nr:NADH-quinone oxidoreductase subunit NuoK [Cyclobacteriaceae bacterium]